MMRGQGWGHGLGSEEKDKGGTKEKIDDGEQG